MADTQTAPQVPAGLQPIPALGGRKLNLPKLKSLNPKRKMNHLRRSLKRKKKKNLRTLTKKQKRIFYMLSP